METSAFKSELRSLSNSLKGLTLQLITSNSARPFTTLKEFGNAILNAEQYYNSFSVTQAWTTEGIIRVTSLKELSQLFKRATITGIQFIASNRHENIEDSLRYDFGTND